MGNVKLTNIERNFMQYIRTFKQKHSYFPSIKTISDYFKKSEQSIKNMLDGLVKKGYLTKGHLNASYSMPLPKSNKSRNTVRKMKSKDNNEMNNVKEKVKSENKSPTVVTTTEESSSNTRKTGKIKTNTSPNKTKNSTKIKKSKLLYNVFHKVKKSLNKIQKTTNIRKYKRRSGKKKESIKLFIFKTLTFFIGIIATIMSLYFTFLWLDTRMDNSIYAGMLTFSMISFGIISFEVMIAFLKHEKFIFIPISFLFFLLWFIITVFSINSTIASLYNKSITETYSSTEIEKRNTTTLYNDYKYQLENLQSDIEDLKKERDLLMNELVIKAPDVNSQNYKDLNWLLTIKKKEINSKQWYFNQIKEEQRELLKTTENNIDLSESGQNNDRDFFEYYSSFISDMVGMKIKSLWIKFILDLFPALFIDLVTVVSFSLVLYLKEL